MTKHELLDYINTQGQVTLQEIADYFNVTEERACIAIKTLRLTGHVNYIAKIYNKYKGRPKKVFALTEIGLKKLQYFDNYDCKNENCSCKE
jgi:predicted ArsR family transcriptional regulator